MAKEESGEAERRRNGRLRAQKQRLAWYGTTAASYALDTLFLALFALAGTVSGNIALMYGAAAAAVSASAYAATASDWNLRLRDPTLVVPLFLAGIAMQLGVTLAAPQIAFPFLANLFTVYAFAMIWLSLRASVVLWLLGVAGMALVFRSVHARLGVPVSSTAELILVWSYFSAILGRCLLLSVAANAMRARLGDSRRKLAASLEQMQRLASHDELTGTLNRRSLLEALEQERQRAERSGASFSVAMIDLDHFKRVNDTYGHAAGDAVLRAISRTARDTMRSTDLFGRYGGEEFILVLVGDNAASARIAMERIRAAVAGQDWSAISPELPVTLSAGIATFCRGESVEQLLLRADNALYQAKDAGRNAIVANPS